MTNNKIKFTEEGHTYTTEIDGKLAHLTSSTTFLSRYSKPFPKEFIAPKSAAKRLREGKKGVTTVDVLDMWALNGDISRLYGNAVHKAVEYWIRFEEYPKTDYTRKVVNEFKKLNLGPCIAEYVMGDVDLMLAGMADIIELVDIDKKIINLLDIKTNADLYDSKGYLLPPFDHLEASNFNKYRLQLSLYKYFLEKEGWTVYNMKLLHWMDDEFATITVEGEDLSAVLAERAAEIKR